MNMVHHWIYPAAVLTIIITIAQCYPSFRNKIPNGHTVEHPCRPNSIWEGVGHLLEAGSGPRNPFGLAFAQNDKVWNSTICLMDSDGDGMSNGQELGDPYCIWTEGDQPTRTTNITHPGYCNGPHDDPNCAANHALFDGYIQCDTADLECDATQSPGVFNITYRLPPTPVPSDDVTTYICAVFNVPSDQPYHMIAYKPHVDNQQVMHHISVMGCMGPPIPDSEIGVPHTCYMGASSSCQIILGVWSLGLSGHCLPDEAGIKIGPGHFTQIAVQLHWTNPLLDDSLTDSSGMTFYFTPNLRPNDAGIFITGQSYLEIPPGLDAHEEVGECPANCTDEFLTGNINVFAALNHMHYLGSKMKIEQSRNGVVLPDITDEPMYSYDSPFLYEHNPPIVVQPGDSLTTSCTYRSLSRQGTTLRGESTFDEMCYGLLYYYPTANVNHGYCIAYKSVSECQQRSGNVNGCQIYNFHNYGVQENIDRRESILNNCPLFGSCSYQCLSTQMTYSNDPCMLGDVYDLIVSKSSNYDQAVQFHIAMLTCDLCYQFYDLSIPENKQFYDSIFDNCLPFGNCLPQCQQAIDANQNHPCMRSGTYEHFRAYAVEQNHLQWLLFHAAVTSCS